MNPSLPLNRRRTLIALAAGCAVGSLAACAGLGRRDFTLSAADLQALIEREFPLDRRLLELVDLTLSRPQVRLVPERNRIATEIELSALERISRRSMRGSLAIEHALRFEPSDATVRLTQVKVNDLKLDIAGGALTGQTSRLGALLAERLLDDTVIWRASDERREALRRANVNGATVEVTARGVEVRFSDPR